MRWKISLFVVLIKLLAVELVVYAAARLLFLTYNYSFFKGAAIDYVRCFAWAVKFDLSAIVYSNVPFVLFAIAAFNNKWYKHWLVFLFVLCNSVCLLLNLIDCGYYTFIYKRTTFDLFLQTGFAQDLSALAVQYLKDYWLLMVLWLIGVIIHVIVARKIILPTIFSRYTLHSIYVKPLQLAVIGGLTILMGRGGVQTRPMVPIDALDYVAPKYAPMLINTPFSIMTTYEQISLTGYNFFTQKELVKQFNPVHKNEQTLRYKNKNIVVIVVESLSKEYMGYYNNGEGYTPFLDSLCGHSTVFMNCYANAKRSIEGVPAVLGGMPSLMNMAYASSSYGTNRINTMAQVLNEQAYNTLFFHGGANGTMGFDHFMNAADYKKYYGLNEYNNPADYDGNWGIWDHKFLPYTIQKLSAFKRPFLAGIFTLSSHHPFSLPKYFEHKFAKGNYDITKTIGYADYALQQFFVQAHKQKWYKNTVFIITADHTGMSTHPYYANMVGRFAVPLLVFDPSINSNRKINYVCQQIDVTPTVINAVGYAKPYYSLGNDLYANTARKRYSLAYHQDIYQYLNDSLAIHYDSKKILALYNYKRDSLLTNNIIADTLKYQPAINHFKAIIQTYNHDLDKNKTYR